MGAAPPSSWKEGRRLVNADPVARFLGRMQNHWLDQVVLPAAAVGFSWAAMALARRYLVFFLPETAVPAWVVLAGVPCALFGVYSASLLSRARGPILLHAAEAVGMVAVLYVLLRLSGAAAGTPFFSTAALRHPQVAGSAAVVLLGWFLAITAGKRFARIGTVSESVERQAEAERLWILPAMTSPFFLFEQREAATDYFGRRTLGCTVVAALLAAAAEGAGPPGELPALWHWSTALGTAWLLFFGLVQQGCVYLYTFRATWDEATVVAAPRFVENWVRNTAVLAALVVVAALLLPAGFAPFDFAETAQRIATWLTTLLSMGVVVFNRMGRQRPDRGAELHEPPAGAAPEGFDLVGGASAAVSLSVFALAIAATAFLIAAVVVLVLRGEWRRLGSLARLPAVILYWATDLVAHLGFLLRAAFDWFLALLGGLGRLAPEEARARREERRRIRRRARGGVEEEALPDVYMRRLFVRLIRAAKAQGVALRPEQTPFEFASEVKRSAEGVDPQVDLLAERYVEVRYGRRTVAPSTVLERAWNDVVAALRRRRLGPRRRTET